MKLFILSSILLDIVYLEDKMNKNIKIIIFLVILVGSYFLGLSVGNYIYKTKLNYDDFLVQNKTENNVDILSSREDIQEVSLNNNKITENTKIVYEYLYKADDFVETFEDLPPYYLVGLERSELEEIFSDWSLISFSPQKVILQRLIEGEGEKIYFLSVYNGNIAIFSKDELNEENLIEITNKPIISLPKDEQEKIKNGIYIKGRIELMKYIQDYES